ncbi:MAG: cysteine--tRNA ligase, partial [Nanoarchaeota archaeon]|nr:cysteine--tRNA ligase [Nanoarchaeota archaeon]
DDKTIRDSQKEGISLKEFTERYTKAFFEDSKKLNLLPADIYAKATEHIEDMRKLIQTLIDKGYAYKGDDNSIYYDVSKFKEYGKLSGIKISELKAGARVKQDEYEKEEANDFALWKAWTPEDGDVFWDVNFTINGKEETIRGRPGWHIECSAMSMKYLGETIDIHAGGVDLIFPHHENEIAQSEAATGKQFVRYWFHNEWVLVEGKKMAKRYKNFYTLRDVLSKGYSAKAVRYLLMSAHYRSQLNFTFNGLKDAETTVNRLLEFMEKLDEIKGGKHNQNIPQLIEDVKKKFESAMDDDLNMPLALSAIHEFVSEINKAIADGNLDEKNAKEVKKIMLDFDKVLGILEYEKAEVPEEIKKLIEEREKLRKQKQFEKADEIREKIRQLGWEVQDTPDGPKVRKKI